MGYRVTESQTMKRRPRRPRPNDQYLTLLKALFEFLTEVLKRF